MAYTLACAQCGKHILHNDDDGIVYYSCGHIEHEECYCDHHPHNLICLICGIVSTFLIFK